MSGLDIEGVLAGHQLIGKSVPAESEHECRYITKPHDGCGCKRLVIGCSGCEWQIEVSDDRIDQHRDHVAAVLREQIAAAQAEAWDEALFAVCVDNGIVYDIGMRPLNPYRAAQVAPSRVPGEESS